MAKRGRKSKGVVRTSLVINQETHAQMEMILMDQRRGRMTYGAYSKVVNILLRQWLQMLHEAEDKLAFLRAYDVPITETEEAK